MRPVSGHEAPEVFPRFEKRLMDEVAPQFARQPVGEKSGGSEPAPVEHGADVAVCGEVDEPVGRS